jgi:hypothetical protein
MMNEMRHIRFAFRIIKYSAMMEMGWERLSGSLKLFICKALQLRHMLRQGNF